MGSGGTRDRDPAVGTREAPGSRDRAPDSGPPGASGPGPGGPAPRVVIHVREGEARAGEFAPLAPPADMNIQLKDLSSRLLQDASVSFDLVLSAGDHELQLFADDVLPVHVPEGCRCTGQLRGGVTAGGGEEALVTGVSLAFDPPVVLANIPMVLAKLGTHFDDHLVDAASRWVMGLDAADQALSDVKFFWRSLARRLASDLEESVNLRRSMAGVVKAAAARLNSTARDLVKVALSRVDALPRYRNDRWELVLGFTGRAEYPGGLSFPFAKVHLPRFVLPVPHASLDRLLSSDPLATARLNTDSLPAMDMARSLLGLASSASGDVRVAGVLPDLELEVGLAGGGVNRMVVPSLGKVEAAFRFTVEMAEEAVTVDLSDGVLGHAGESTAFSARGRLSRQKKPGLQPRGSVAWECVRSLTAGHWPPEGVGVDVSAQIRPGGPVPGVDVLFHSHHPLLKGKLDLRLRLSDLSLSGGIDLSFGVPGVDGPFRRTDIAFSCGMRLLEGSVADLGSGRLTVDALQGSTSGKLYTTRPNFHRLELSGSAAARLGAAAEIKAFPEMSVDDGQATATLEGSSDFDFKTAIYRRGASPAEVDFSGSSCTLRLDSGRMELAGRKLHLPTGTKVAVHVEDAVLSASGLGRAAFGVAWDFRRRSPVVEGPGGTAELFVPAMLSGDVTVKLSPAGGLSVSGPDRGMYDARFFNALLHPADEPERIRDILTNDEALDRVLGAVRAFSPRVIPWLERIRSFVKTGRGILEAEGIHAVRDAIPGPAIARLLSRLLSGAPDRADQIYPIVKRVTDGNGLDIPGVKRLIAEVHPDHPYEFEVDRLLRILAQLLRPADPVGRFPVKEAVPLAEDPRYRVLFEDLPSAVDIYDALASPEPFPDHFSSAVARVAPYMTLEQTEYLLGNGRAEWRGQDLTRLRTVRELKHRARMISQEYGGLSFAPQAVAISFFLGETIRMGARSSREGSGRAWEPLLPEGCLLGPEDIAVLLQSGLASAWPGRAVQLNQRMLLSLLLEQPSDFVAAVLAELGEFDDRVLTSALFALLDHPQDLLAEPLDLVSVLSARLGIEIPRMADFMAGGRRAGGSYYEALSHTAYRILAEVEPYRALKFYVQEARRKESRVRPRGLAARERKAQAAIRKADRVRTRPAYEAAFSACAALIKEDACAFQQDWLKQFWTRNFEALTVLSVVRNVQDDTDGVRRWLRVRSRAPIPKDEQALVDAVIDVLYWREEDRGKLKADPLVRLLIDPPEGQYDFTIVSCMGVITQGAHGFELQEAYRRIRRKRGVRVVRADTANMRSLKFNAHRILDAVRTVTTPYGFIGYSQGCANALMAESMLHAGPPDVAPLLDRLVCRNLLFGAHNGSLHGTCGDRKMLQALIDLDHFMAHYQAVLSRPAILLAQSFMRLALDSRAFVSGVLGSRSLSRFGVLALQAGGQFKASAPTSVCRGIVEQETLPEALEMLSNVLTRQLESPLHDTQVALEDGVGYPVWVTNEQSRVLKACDTGCMLQRTHHWSPLKKDTEIVCTRRDIDLAIYEFPKDRHVFPWVEVNARFGVIPKKG